MSDQNQEAYDKAMAELDDIQKSDDAIKEDELDALTKSLEEELAEDLSKSDKPNPFEKKDDDEDGDDSDDDDDDEAKKSMSDDFDDELIKASEAYADLTKSVEEGIGGIYSELDSMKKSMAALMNLNIKQAKVIAELAKSRKEDTDSIAKSIQAMGATPTAPGKAVLGIGASDAPAELKKSVAEITELLVKAANEGKIDTRYLSIFGTYKTVDTLPDSVKQTIGI